MKELVRVGVISSCGLILGLLTMGISWFIDSAWSIPVAGCGLFCVWLSGRILSDVIDERFYWRKKRHETTRSRTRFPWK